MSNEHHIERIIKSYRDDPVMWIYSSRHIEFSFKQIAEAYDDAKERPPIIDRSFIDMGYAAQMAILCLITHEESSYMLDASLDELRLLINLGDKRASLMYPACRILKESA